MAKFEQTELAVDPIQDAMDFFDRVADEDLLRFLRSLPVIGLNEEDHFTVEDLVYEAMLQPYVLQAWKTVDGDPGVGGRIMQITHVYKAAETALERETGRKRRIPRMINITAFMDAYTSRGLPL